MNGFYGLKRITGNSPADVPLAGPGTIAHPAPHAARTRLSA